MDEDETLAEEAAPDTDAAGSDAPDPAATIEDALARLATIEAKIDAGFAQLAERIDASVAVAVENGGSVGELLAPASRASSIPATPTRSRSCRSTILISISERMTNGC